MPKPVYLFTDMMKRKRCQHTFAALEAGYPICFEGQYYRYDCTSSTIQSLDKYGLLGWREDPMYPIHYLKERIKRNIMPGCRV